MKLLWPGTEKSPFTGRSYCFQLKSLLVIPYSKKIMLNQYVYEMERQAMGDENEIFVPLPELVRIFSPYLRLEEGGTVRCGEEMLRFEADYRCVWCQEERVMLKKPPFEKDDWLYIPFGEVMEKVFGLYVYRIGSLIGAAACREDSQILFDGPGSQPFSERRVRFRTEKTYGDRYFTLWMEEAKRLNVYRMYVPFSYDGSKAYKLVLCLHGGNGNSDTVFLRSRQTLQYYAEKYRFILLAPNSYVHGSNYGGIIPPVHMFPEPEKKPERPEYYSREEVAENQVAQGYLEQVLKEVLGAWNIDRDHMFVMGNSMGSVGTFHVLSAFPQLFRAGAPSGTMPLTEYLDLDVLKGKPIYYMTGTEDSNDPADMWERYQKLREEGLDIRFQTIGGGYHPDAWVREIDPVFRFFDEIR